jgi:hypothetical protein
MSSGNIPQRTLLESIQHMPVEIQQVILQEAPHTHFFNAANKSGLEILDATIVDLGFEDLGLQPERYQAIMQAYAGAGVRVPQTSWKIRATPRFGVVEPSNGTEVSLPDNWQESVVSLGTGDRVLWIGRRVRPDRTPDVDQYKMRETPEGWAEI